MSTTTLADRQTGEVLEIVELAEAPFEMAIREEFNAEQQRLVVRYGIPKERAIKEAHERIKRACAAIADDQMQILQEGGFRQTRMS